MIVFYSLDGEDIRGEDDTFVALFGARSPTVPSREWMCLTSTIDVKGRCKAESPI